MDFNRLARNEESSFLCTPPNGYFASQDPRAVLLGRAAMPNPPLPLPDHKAIARNIMKSRIREEILVREMAERRILEAEVRREIEIERIMETRRIQMEKLSLLGGPSHMSNQGNPLTQPFFPSWPQATGGASRNFAEDAAEFTIRERSQSHLLEKKPLASVEDSSLHHKSEKFSPAEERKTPEKFLVQTEKEWGCALCKVRAPCESGLKAHLQGKKHKAIQSLLGFKNTFTDHKEAAFTSSKKNSLRKEPLLTSQKTIHSQKKKNETLQMKDSSANGPRNEKQPPVKAASASEPAMKLWCPLCKVMCNSKTMLENHRGGKKHQASMELKKAGSSSATKAGKEEVGAVAEGLVKGEPGTEDP